MTSRLEPRLVSGPSSARPRAKILGHMMELKRPTRMMLHMATWPKVNMDVTTRQQARMAATPSTGPARSFWVMPAPQKRPIMAPPQ